MRTKLIYFLFFMTLTSLAFPAKQAPTACYAVSFRNIEDARKSVNEFFLQPRNNPKYLLEQATYHSGELNYVLNRIAVSFKGESLGANIKTHESLNDKLVRKNMEGKMSSEIFDYLRGTVVFDNLHSLTSAFNFVNQQYPGKVGHIKNYFTKVKKSGYRAVHFSIELRDGYKAEVQFHLRELLETKQKKGDMIYHAIRMLEIELGRLQQKLEKRSELEERVSDLETRSSSPELTYTHKGKMLSKEGDIKLLELELKELGFIRSHIDQIQSNIAKLENIHRETLDLAWETYLEKHTEEDISLQ